MSSAPSTRVEPTYREAEGFRARLHDAGREWDAAMEIAHETYEEFWPTVLSDFVDGMEMVAAMEAPRAPSLRELPVADFLRGIARGLVVHRRGFAVPLLMGGAGEGNLLVETRRPTAQTGSFASTSPLTTSVSVLPLNGTSFMTPASYWDIPKEQRFVLMGQITTGTTPGNWTTELRYQNAVPLTNAGGTILATSATVAAGASKTAISFVLWGRCHSRAPVSSSAGTLFAWGMFAPDQVAVVLPAANNPQIIPAASAAAVNTLDTVSSGGFSVQMKRSGSTAEAVQIHDLSVEAVT